METCGLCALVTHSFAGFLTWLRLEENRKLVGYVYIGAYTTPFHGITYTCFMLYTSLENVILISGIYIRRVQGHVLDLSS